MDTVKKEVKAGDYYVEHGSQLSRVYQVVRVMKAEFELEEVGQFPDQQKVGLVRIKANLRTGKIVGSRNWSSRWVHEASKSEVDEIRQKNAEKKVARDEQRAEDRAREARRIARARRLNAGIEITPVFEGEGDLWKCKLNTTDEGTLSMIFTVNSRVGFRDRRETTVDYTIFQGTSRSSGSCTAGSVRSALIGIAAGKSYKMANDEYTKE